MPHPPGSRRARYARRVAAGRALRSCDAGFEAGLELGAIEISADEHQPAAARRLGAPRPLQLSIEHHVHAVEYVAPILTLEIEHALHAQDVRSATLQQVRQPVIDLVR